MLTENNCNHEFDLLDDICEERCKLCGLRRRVPHDFKFDGCRKRCEHCKTSILIGHDFELVNDVICLERYKRCGVQQFALHEISHRVDSDTLREIKFILQYPEFYILAVHPKFFIVKNNATNKYSMMAHMHGKSGMANNYPWSKEISEEQALCFCSDLSKGFAFLCEHHHHYRESSKSKDNRC